MTTPIRLLCFTDLLCGFCYLVDQHLEQLKVSFGHQIEISYHFMSVYGDVRRRIDRSGKTQLAYGAMVRDTMKRYEHVEVHPEVFRDQPPTSSVPAHLYLRAVKLLEDQGLLERDHGPPPFERLMWRLRVAYFRDLEDISKREVLDQIAGGLNIPCDSVARVIDDGRAFAELANDTELQRMHQVAVTPSLALAGSHVLLAGNFNYGELENALPEIVPAIPSMAMAARRR